MNTQDQKRTENTRIQVQKGRLTHLYCLITIHTRIFDRLNEQLVVENI